MSSSSSTKNNYEQLKQSSSQEINVSGNKNNNNNNSNGNQNNIASTSTAVPESPKLKQELDEYMENQRNLLSSPMDELSQEEYNKILKEYRTLLDLYRQKKIDQEQKKTLNERHQTLIKYQFQHLNPEQQEQFLKQQREQAKVKKLKEQERKKKEMYHNLRYYAKEMTSIIRPVILCICLSILWVKLTRNTDTSQITSSDINIIGGGNGASSDDSSSDESNSEFFKSLLNSFLNAGIIIVNIVIATFIILLLFKFNCLKLLYGLFIFTVFMLIGIFGFNLLLTLISTFNIPMDWITLTLFMFNLSIVGIIVIFWKGPAKVQQGYLILMSSLMAFSLTGLYDWTTWILLALLACWDLIAVLCPFGPLKMLIDHSDSNKQIIPKALIYSTMVWMMAHDVRIKINDENGDDDDKMEKYELQKLNSSLVVDEASSQGSTQELISNKESSINNNEDYKIEVNNGNNNDDDEIEELEEINIRDDNHSRHSTKSENDDDDDDDDENKSLTSSRRTSRNSKGKERQNEQNQGNNENNEDEDDEEDEEGLKLGLGDFVFYSVLIARAAMHDWITTFACAIAVLFGLTLTIFLLSIYQKALPALPISIVLGIIFYFISSSMLGELMKYLARIPVAENNMNNYSSDLKIQYGNGLSFVYL